MSQKIGGKVEPEVVNPKKACHVFWDYENCRKPRDVSFEESYKALRDTLGSINMTMRQLNLYCDETLLESGGRQTLNDLGCSVINPSKVDPMNNKKKETSDLRMAVDMSMYAFDHAAAPENCAIVLISSDSDFGHLLAQLRSRSYEIVLICNKNAPARLTAHANRCIRVYDLFVQTEQYSESPELTAVPAISAKHPSPVTGSPKRTTSPSFAPLPLSAMQMPPPIVPVVTYVPSQAASHWRHFKPSLDSSLLVDDDDSSIYSQQLEQEDLRVNDLVAIVADLMKKSGGAPVYDSAVGIAFKKTYPALAAKSLYKPTKFAAIQRGKLLATEKASCFPGSPPSHLLAVA